MAGPDGTDAAGGPGEVILARLRRPWGRRGELILELHTDWPAERFVAGRTVRLRWDDGRTADRVVRAYRELGQGHMLAFEGVDDIGRAQDLAGAWLVADRSALDATGDDGPTHADLLGLAVVTVAGEAVGRVAGIEEAAHADLLQVRTPAGREVLVPLAPAICTDVDVAGGRIVIDPPEGLIDLDRAETVRDANPDRPRARARARR